jgi:hypothetical protein
MKNIIYQSIDEGQYLQDIWTVIPSNIILSKTLTGIGATTLEIESPRHSIIIEPNVPVIQGKMGKYNTKTKIVVRGVFENVTDDQLLTYMESTVIYKKFIVTPESFRRVKELLESAGTNMYEEYFLLFDECERAVQDVSYRGDVILPMNDFFKFSNKAFISATPIMPSDPRFLKHKFQSLIIKPTFVYKRNLQLIITDYTLFTLQKYINENPRDKYFIFIKSTEQIAHIVRSLKIMQESAIFCARDSKEKLRANNFVNVSTVLDDFKKYNFFTSRFNSAVDIEYDGEPTVILISDIITTEHSKVDPMSEVVQIAGRFRKDLKDLVHITNINPLIKYQSKEEVMAYIKESHTVYKVVRQFYDGSTTLTAKETLRQMLLRIDYARYIDWKGARNYYMVDNTLHEEKVKSYYKDAKNLFSAYELSEQFKVEITWDKSSFTDEDLLKIKKAKRLKSVYEVMIPILKDLYKPGNYTDFHIYFMELQLKLNYPKVLADFKRIGYDEAEKLEFDPKQIKKAIVRLNNKDTEVHFGLIEFISKNFKKHKCYRTQEITDILTQGLQDLNLVTLKPGVALLKKFCTVMRCNVENRTKDSKEVKGYVIEKLSKS